MQPNAAGIAHDADMADLPSQVYESSEIIVNGSPGVGNIKTTTPVSSLSANLQAALPITLGAGAGGLADGLEADLAYMSFPKKRGGHSRYEMSATHTLTGTFIPVGLVIFRSLCGFKKHTVSLANTHTVLLLGEVLDLRVQALTNLTANFNSETDTTITVADVRNFPYAGVCEIWTNNPNPFVTNMTKQSCLHHLPMLVRTLTQGN